MNKLAIGIIVLICVGIIGAGVFYVLNKSTVAPDTQSGLDSSNTVTEATSAAKEKIVYRKVLEYTDKGWLRSELIVSNIDGSNKEVLVNDRAADFLFIKERAEVVIIDHIGQKIEKLSLKTKERQTIFDSKSFGVEFIGDGIPGESMAILSPNKTQLVFPAGNQFFDHPKVILINLVDRTIPPEIIYTPGHSVVLRYWDNADRIYGYPDAHKGVCGPLSPQFAITSSGQVSQTPFSIKELFAGQNLLSPDGNYFASSQENPQGPLFLGMCDSRAHGIFKLYSAKNGATSIIESNPLKSFSTKQWTADSKYLIYEMFSYPQWSGNPTDTNVGNAQTEGFVIYDLATKTKSILKSQVELDSWLKNNDPGSSHVVKFSEATSAERPEDKNLYIDGKIVDSVEKFPWSFGPAGFGVLGFIKN